MSDYWKEHVEKEALPAKLLACVDAYFHECGSDVDLLEAYKTDYEFGELVYDEFHVFLLGYKSGVYECCHMSLRVDPPFRAYVTRQVEIQKMDRNKLESFAKLLKKDVSPTV